jgi:WD40 repeat protein
MVNIPGEMPNVILDLDDPDNNSEQHISKVSFDPSGEYYAVAYEEGNVMVYEFESSISNNNWIEMISFGDVQEIRRPVLSIKIDPTRTWLALLYENELQIWDLMSVKKNPSVSLAISSMNTMTFDQSGNLLVVGTKSGLRFIDLHNKSEVAKFDGDEVSNAFITTDNRLLVWSDTKGIIHLWGATVP